MYILSTEDIPTQLELLTMILYFLFMFVPSVFCESYISKRYFKNFADYLDLYFITLLYMIFT
jgi:hypothetical protein